MAMHPYDEMNVAEQAKRDARIDLMEQMVKLEQDEERNDRNAEKACAVAAATSDELARVRAQLHDALGVASMQAGEDSVNIRAARSY